MDQLAQPPRGESHRRQTRRLLVALALTVLGFALPVPYAGYTFSLLLFAPAAALELIAIAIAGDRGSRVVGGVLGALTAAGLLLSIGAAIDLLAHRRMSLGQLVPLVLVAALFTALAAVAGRRRRA